MRARVAAWAGPLANFAASQVVWFLSLVGAATGRHWLGAACLALFVALQWRLSTSPARDLRLGLAAAAAGVVLDTTWVRAGLMSYAAPLPVAGFAPYWIVLMWVNFGLTLDCSLRWLQRRPLLGAALGAVGGPLAYLAGFGLGAAVRTGPAVVTYGALALAWAVVVPALLWLAGRPAARA